MHTYPLREIAVVANVCCSDYIVRAGFAHCAHTALKHPYNFNVHHTCKPH